MKHISEMLKYWEHIFHSRKNLESLVFYYYEAMILGDLIMDIHLSFDLLKKKYFN